MLSKASLDDKEYLNAILMAFRLNEGYLIHRVYENIPIKDIPLIAHELPVVYVSRILKFIGEYALESQHLEFNLLWIKSVLTAHGKYISTNKHQFFSALRAVQRFIGRMANDVVQTYKRNKYTLDFLTNTDGSSTNAVDEDMNLLGNDSDNESEDKEDINMDDDLDGGEWVGFEEKTINLPVNDEDSDDEILL